MMEWLKIIMVILVCVYSQSSTEKSSSNMSTLNDNWIAMIRNFKYPVVEDFQVLWNVPTNMCRQYKIFFEETLKSFDITVNTGDEFNGDKIVILYDPGLFPAMIKHPNKSITERNGGIPQKGNLTEHLEAFEDDINKYVYANFTGFGVIDFEAWRPIFRQNWNSQVIYKNMSIELVKKNRTTSIDAKEMNKTAAQEFEKYARKFMEGTLKKAKDLRPKAKWGFYGFPYCYGFRVNRTGHCPSPVAEENDRIHWLFNESTALYPSIYVSNNLTTEEQKQFYTGKLNEVWRVTSNVSDRNGNFPPIFPYFWFNYNNEDNFLSENDTYEALENTMKYRIGGMIVWGASKNVNSLKKCNDLLNYVQTIFGPTFKKVRENNKHNFDKSWKILGERDLSHLNPQILQIKINNENS